MCQLMEKQTTDQKDNKLINKDLLTINMIDSQ